MLNSQFIFRPGTEIGQKFKTLRAESLSKIPLRVHNTMMFRPGSMVQPQEPILYDFDKINEIRAAKYGTKVYLDGQAPLYTIDSVDENGNTVTKTVSMGQMGKDITTNLQELVKAVSSNNLSEQIKISALEEAFSNLDSMASMEVENLTTEKQKLIGLLAKKLNDGKVSKPTDLGIIPKYTTKKYTNAKFPVILSYLCANQDQKGKVVMNDYGTKLNIPELVKSMKDTDILDLNNKRLISSMNFYDMYKKGQISGIVDDEDAINFINDRYAWKIDEEDEERKEKEREKKSFLDDIEEEYKERIEDEENPEKFVAKIVRDIAKRAEGVSKKNKKADEFAKAQLLKKTFKGMKGFVPRQVAKIEGKYDTPIKSSKEPGIPKKNPQTKSTTTVQTLFEPVIKGNFTKKEGTKQEVYDGTAEYHKTAKGDKKYKQDITLKNNKAVLR